MIDYTISKIGEDIILTLPTEKVTYYNTYNSRTYTNCSNGITLKKTLITHSYLENIKIGAEDITHATQEDITMQFRTTTGNIININCGENSAELYENTEKGITATDFTTQPTIISITTTSKHTTYINSTKKGTTHIQQDTRRY